MRASHGSDPRLFTDEQEVEITEAILARYLQSHPWFRNLTFIEVTMAK
jgi:hypothetical protein